MEFTPFVCYLIYIVIISIPFQLLHLRNKILNGKFSPAFYILSMFIYFGLEGYITHYFSNDYHNFSISSCFLIFYKSKKKFNYANFFFNNFTFFLQFFSFLYFITQFSFLRRRLIF